MNWECDETRFACHITNTAVPTCDKNNLPRHVWNICGCKPGHCRNFLLWAGRVAVESWKRTMPPTGFILLNVLLNACRWTRKMRQFGIALTKADSLPAPEVRSIEVATNDPGDIGKHGRSETGPRQLSVELRQTAVKPVTVRLGDLIGQHMTAAQPVTVRLEPHRCEISCAGSRKDVVLLSCILLVFTYILQIKSSSTAMARYARTHENRE